MEVLSALNPLTVFRKFVKIPVEAFARKQYLDYKLRTNKGITSVKELLLKAGIISVFVTAILWISVFMYVVFYYTYMPNVTHVRPVYLQFKSCDEHAGVCSFPAAHVQLTRRSLLLMAAQPYRIRLMIDMPESQVNKDLGMFMVCAQMRAKGGVLVSSSCRSAMLRHRCIATKNIRYLLKMSLEKLNEDQMDILLNFAERCPYLCFGRAPTGSTAESIAYRAWKELSRDMNYAGKGPSKSGAEWKQFWDKFKSRTKTKACYFKRKARASGQPPQQCLNAYEQRVMELAEIAKRAPIKLETESATETESLPSDQPQDYSLPSSPQKNPPVNGNGSLKTENRENPNLAIPSVIEQRQTYIGRLADSLAALAASQTELARANNEIAKALNGLRGTLV